MGPPFRLPMVGFSALILRARSRHSTVFEVGLKLAYRGAQGNRVSARYSFEHLLRNSPLKFMIDAASGVRVTVKLYADSSLIERISGHLSINIDAGYIEGISSLPTDISEIIGKNLFEGFTRLDWKVLSFSREETSNRLVEIDRTRIEMKFHVLYGRTVFATVFAN